ncbi:hypothetical protein [Roseobacter weihaiensis]|uniref:hypothetical protein n=1 Tax=Roseobacter weihaiensis TaxID=2763262 RepID=UPI001D0A6566|nr:hypothetical protein [Roseobacter sp. H9]
MSVNAIDPSVAQASMATDDPEMTMTVASRSSFREIDESRLSERERDGFKGYALVVFVEQTASGIDEVRVSVPVFQRDGEQGFHVLASDGTEVALAATTLEAAKAEAAALISSNGGNTDFRLQPHHFSARQTHESVVVGAGNALIPTARTTEADGAAYYDAIKMASENMKSVGDFQLGDPTFEDSNTLIPEDATDSFREGFQARQGQDRAGFWTLSAPNGAMFYAGALQVPLFLRAGRQSAQNFGRQPPSGTSGTSGTSNDTSGAHTTIDLTKRTLPDGTSVYVPSQVSPGLALARTQSLRPTVPPQSQDASAGLSRNGQSGASTLRPPTITQPGQFASPMTTSQLVSLATQGYTAPQRMLIQPALEQQLHELSPEAQLAFVQNLARNPEALADFAANVSRGAVADQADAHPKLRDLQITAYSKFDESAAVEASFAQNAAVSLNDGEAMHSLPLRIATPTGDAIVVVSGTTPELVSLLQSETAKADRGEQTVYYDETLARRGGRTLGGLVSTLTSRPGETQGGTGIESRSGAGITSQHTPPDVQATMSSNTPPGGGYLGWTWSAALTPEARSTLQDIQTRLDIRSGGAMDRIAALVGSGTISVAEAEAALTAFVETGTLSLNGASLVPTGPTAANMLDVVNPQYPAGVTAEPVPATGGSVPLAEAFKSVRRSNVGVSTDAGYTMIVPRADMSLVKLENLTLLQAVELADQAALAFPDVSARDILISGNGIVPPALEGALNTRQSEVVNLNPSDVQIGPPDATLPTDGLPAWMTGDKALTQARIDNVIQALNNERGFRASLVEPIEAQLQDIATGDYNTALYRKNPAFFNAKQGRGLDRRVNGAGTALSNIEPQANGSYSKENLDAAGEALAVIYRDGGVLSSQAQNRFGQYRAGDEGSFPDNTTVIGSYVLGENQTTVLDGPYKTIFDSIDGSIEAYGVVERARDGSWQPVTFATDAERIEAAEAVLDGTDSTRGIQLQKGGENTWIYTWGPMTRRDDMRLGVFRGNPDINAKGWTPPFEARAFIGIAPAVTDAVTTENLQVVQDLINHGGMNYDNGAAENGVIALLAANVRALPMITDRSQASNTITNAVVLAASREVVLGNSAYPAAEGADPKPFDLNVPPITMPPEDALRLQLERTPVKDARTDRTGQAYSDTEKEAALVQVMQDLFHQAPEVYRYIFGDQPPPTGGASPTPTSTPPTDGGDGGTTGGDDGATGVTPQSDPTGELSSQRLTDMGFSPEILGQNTLGNPSALRASTDAVLSFAASYADMTFAVRALRSVNRQPVATAAALDALPESLRARLDDAGTLSNAEVLARTDVWLRDVFGVGAMDVMPMFRLTDMDAFLARVSRLPVLAQANPSILGWTDPLSSPASLDEVLPQDESLRRLATAALGDLEDVDDGPATLDIYLTLDQFLLETQGVSVTATAAVDRRMTVAELVQRAAGLRPATLPPEPSTEDAGDVPAEVAYIGPNGEPIALSLRTLNASEITESRVDAELGGLEASAFEKAIVAATLEKGAVTATNATRLSYYGEQLPSSIAEAQVALDRLVDAGVLVPKSTRSVTRYVPASLNSDFLPLAAQTRKILSVLAIAPENVPISMYRISQAIGYQPGNSALVPREAVEQGLVTVTESGVVSNLSIEVPDEPLSTEVRGKPIPYEDINLIPLYTTPRGASAREGEIIRALHLNGEMSRREIAARDEIQRAHLTTDLEGLIERGIVIALGDGAGTARGEATYALAANVDVLIDTALPRGTRQLLRFIADNGPINSSEIQRAFSGRSAQQTVQRHIKRLRDSNAIVRDASGGWVPSSTETTAAREVTLGDTDRQILTALESGGKSRPELAQMILGGSDDHDQIRYHLDKLQDAGLIEKAARGRTYYLANSSAEAQLSDNQAAALSIVRETGSTTVPELAQETGLTKTQIRLITDILEERGLIDRHGAGRGLYFVPQGEMALNPSQLAIYSTLQDAPKTMMGIREATGLSRAGAAKIVASMLEAGTIERVRSGGDTTYRIAED